MAAAAPVAGVVVQSIEVRTVDLWRRSAAYVDKILKGSRPADMPVEQPIKFELVINAKTATALGLKIPQSMLVRGGEMIH